MRGSRGTGQPDAAPVSDASPLSPLSESERDAFWAQLRFHFENAPFPKFLGMRVPPLSEGRGRIELPFREELIGDFTRRVLHGGALSALIDSCGGLALWALAGPSARLATIDLRVDFLKPAQAQPLVAEGRVLRLGKRVGVAEVQCFHPEAPDDLVALGIGVYNVMHLKADGTKG